MAAARQDRIEFRIPLKAVSINAYHTLSGRRIIISRVGREYQQQVKEYLPEGYIDGKIKISLTFYFTTRRKRDLDNVVKPLVDIMKDCLFGDDDLVYSYTLEKVIDADIDCIDVCIERLPEI